LLITIDYVVISDMDERSAHPSAQAAGPPIERRNGMLRTADMAVLEFRRSEPGAPAAPSAGGLRGLLCRLGLAPTVTTGDDEEDVRASDRLATHDENRLQALRANARAAFDSVEGGGDPALDAALDVVEAEVQAARATRDTYAEALKAIRLYATDPKARDIAAGALARPRQTAAWDAGLHVTGRDRIPFTGDYHV
jgi:hypothetical protein